MRSWTSRLGLVFVLFLLGVCASAAPKAADNEVKVTVLAILATDQNDKVDPRLKCIAEKMHKLKPSLTGYRLERTTSKSLTIGKEHKFPLVDKETVRVTVEHGADKKNRIGLSVQTPQLGEISYNCCCGKFLPIWTDYKTKKKECLFIAIMVEPCNEECCHPDADVSQRR